MHLDISTIHLVFFNSYVASDTCYWYKMQDNNSVQEIKIILITVSNSFTSLLNDRTAIFCIEQFLEKKILVWVLIFPLYCLLLRKNFPVTLFRQNILQCQTEHCHHWSCYQLIMPWAYSSLFPPAVILHCYSLSLLPCFFFSIPRTQPISIPLDGRL